MKNNAKGKYCKKGKSRLISKRKDIQKLREKKDRFYLPKLDSFVGSTETTIIDKLACPSFGFSSKK